MSQRIQSSCPDLIRASIKLHETLAKKMDHRVKPGDDMVAEATDLPDRLICDTLVKPLSQKYSAFQNIRIILYCSPSRPTKRGVS